jgi:WD40 repeat protein
MPEAVTFEISVQRPAESGWLFVVQQSAGGEWLPRRDEVRLTAAEGDSLVADLRGLSDHAEYGRRLGESVFRGGGRDLWEKAVGAGGPLHVLLTVEDERLAALRWERLMAPLDGVWTFLLLAQRTPYSFYLPSNADRLFPPIGRADLRALVVVSSPADPPGAVARLDLPPLDVAATLDGLRRAFAAADIRADVLALDSKAVGRPTCDDLCERLTAVPYTLLHLVCHGRHLGAGGCVLYLSDPDNAPAPVQADVLVERLRLLRGPRGLPRLTFLSVCESAHASESSADGCAQKLVRVLGMPGVVAMRDPVSVPTATRLCEAFYRRLAEHGQTDVALAEARAGLFERYDVKVPALYGRLGSRPLFSADPGRPLGPADVRRGLEQLAKLLPARAPVLTAEFDQTRALLREPDADPRTLTEAARREHEQGMDALNRLCGDVLEMSFRALALGAVPPAYDDRCPFRGLAPFRPDDREFFFGRDRLVGDLHRRLADHRFLAVLGPSGSGKSSVVLAGLVRACESESPARRAVCLTPGPEPLRALESALAGAADVGLVVVDQFEELFTLCRDEAQRQAFITRLLTETADRRVVVTMRADFLGDCAAYPALRGLMQANQELVAPLTPDELRQVAEQQAAKVGLRFEAGLAARILDDVREEPGAMPLWQHALRELWTRRHGRWLRAEEYEATGRIRGAITQTAEAVYRGLTAPEQVQVRDLFLRLTRLDEPSRADARRDTRRRVPLSDLVPAGADREEVRGLVKRLADAALLVTRGGENGPTVEVAHEALIRHWPRLRDEWLEGDRQRLRLRAALSEAAADHERAGDEGLLWRGNRLAEAEKLAGAGGLPLTEREKTFVAASVERQARRDRERRRTWWLIRGAIAAAVLCVIVALALGLWDARKTADYNDERKAAAEKERDTAKRNAAEQKELTARETKARKAAQANRYLSSMKLAYQFWQSGHTVDMLRELDGWSWLPSDEVQRDFEWYHFRLLARGKEVVLDSQSEEVTAVAYAPAADRIAVGNEAGFVKVWGLTSRQLFFQTPCSSPVSALAFSADGRLLAVGQASGEVTVIEFVPSAPVLVRHAFSAQAPIRCLAFGPDNRLVLGTALAKNLESRSRLVLCDVAAEKVLFDRRLPQHVAAVSFAESGRRVHAVLEKGTCWRFSAADGSGAELPNPFGPFAAVAFQPDGRRVVLGQGNGRIRLGEVGVKSETEFRAPGGGLIRHIACAPDGEHFACSGKDGEWIGVFVTEGKELQHLDLSPKPGDGSQQPGCSCLCYLGGAGNQARLAWGNESGNVVVSDPNGTKAMPDLRLVDPGRKQAVEASSFSADGKHIVLAVRYLDEARVPIAEMPTLVKLQVFDAETGAVVRTFDRLEAEAISPPAVVVEKGRLAVRTGKGAVRILPLGGGATEVNVRAASDAAVIALSADGNLLVTGGAGPTEVWDAASGRRLRRLDPAPARVDALAIDPTGKRLAVAEPHALTLYDPATGELVVSFRFEDWGWKPTVEKTGDPGEPVVTLPREVGTVYRLCFAGDFLDAVASNLVFRCNWRTGTMVWAMGLPQYLSPGHVAIHPGGRRVALAVMPRKIRLVDASFEEVVSLDGLQGRVTTLSFGPDGRSLVAGYDNGGARLWRAPPEPAPED